MDAVGFDMDGVTFQVRQNHSQWLMTLLFFDLRIFFVKYMVKFKVSNDTAAATVSRPLVRLARRREQFVFSNEYALGLFNLI